MAHTSQDWNNLHERLRSETRALHDALEAAVDVNAQISTLDRYREHLLRLWRIHSAIANDLAGVDFASIGYDFDARRRLALLERDLNLLGVFDDQSSQAAIAPPKLTSIAAALGTVYVIEGSALGGRAILPDLSNMLGIDEASGAAFFTGFGREEKHFWRACVKAINAVEPDSYDADTAADAAKSTFSLFLRWLPSTPTSNTTVALRTT